MKKRWRVVVQKVVETLGSIGVSAETKEEAAAETLEAVEEWTRLGKVPRLHDAAIAWDEASTDVSFRRLGVVPDFSGDDDDVETRDVCHEFISEVFGGQESLNDSAVPAEESAEKLAAIARTFLSRLEGGS